MRTEGALSEADHDGDMTMELTPERQRQILDALVTSVLSHTTELTDLDRAIGDGDHGINLERGFTAVRAELDALCALPLGPALNALGKRLVLTVGGASGPLFGTLFMVLGDRLGAGNAMTANAIVAACDAAVAAVKARGKSDAGQKTMLDVLVPVQEELRAGGPALPARLREKAESAAASTIPMLARRGRAAFLGERSVGHMDPGARSSQLMIAAVCDVLQRAEVAS
jgi:phosphoenolpyruvate---glycerone phosphotransferase subunit DhaL